MSTHTATIEWLRGAQHFTDGRYSRAHAWRFDGGAVVNASSSPHVVPLPMSIEAAVDPEEAFVASVASCHMLWFLSIAGKRRYVVDSYVDHAVGTMGTREDGKAWISQVVLRPRVVFSGDRVPGEEELEQMHERAHEECFIANSVRSEVRVETV